MKGKRSSIGRPLSSAASFFKRNGASEKAGNNPPVPARAARSATRVLECQPDERELLATSVLPAIINYLGDHALHLEDLFVKDPSASTQDAMMGLVSPSQREPVRALRELLDARYSGDESSVFPAHDPYIWAIALKVCLKELSRPLVPSNVAVSLIEANGYDNDAGKAEFLKRSFLPGCPEVVQSLFLLLSVTATDKSKLGFMFSALLFLSVQSGQDDADFARLSSGVQALSNVTSFLVSNAEMVFGQAPWKPKAKAPPPPPPPPPKSNAYQYDNNNGGGADDYDDDDNNGGNGGGYYATPSPPMMATNNTATSMADLPPASTVYPGASDEVLFTAICVYDFDPVEPDELTLRIGDVISVHYVGPDDWYWGRVTLPEGMIEEGVFPAVYVKKDETRAPPPPPVPKQQRSPETFTKTVAPPPPPPTGPKPAGGIVAPPVYQPAFQDDDEDDLTSQLEKASLHAFSSSGPPPAPPQQHIATTTVASSASSFESLPLRTPDGIPAVAIFDFVPEEAGELALTKGESILVLDRTDPEWWLAKRARDGVQGLFPFNYAKLVEGGYEPVVHKPAPPVPAAAPAPVIKTAASAPPAAPQPATTSTPSPSSAQGGGGGAGRGLQRASSSRGGARPPPPPPPPAAAAARAPAPAPPSSTPAAAPVNRAPAPLPPAASPPPQAREPAPLPPGTGRGAAPALQTVPPSDDVNPVAMGWYVTPEMLAKYHAFFVERPKDALGRVGGRDCALFLQESGLERQYVARILELSDIDDDGAFDADEFALAFHLALCVSRRKMPLYSKLPRYLIPPSKQHLVPLLND